MANEKSFAQMAQDIHKKYSLRQNDPMSQKAMESELIELAKKQELVKAQQEQQAAAEQAKTNPVDFFNTIQGVDTKFGKGSSSKGILSDLASKAKGYSPMSFNMANDGGQQEVPDLLDTYETPDNVTQPDKVIQRKELDAAVLGNQIDPNTGTKFGIDEGDSGGYPITNNSNDPNKFGFSNFNDMVTSKVMPNGGMPSFLLTTDENKLSQSSNSPLGGLTSKLAIAGTEVLSNMGNAYNIIRGYNNLNKKVSQPLVDAQTVDPKLLDSTQAINNVNNTVNAGIAQVNNTSTGGARQANLLGMLADRAMAVSNVQSKYDETNANTVNQTNQFNAGQRSNADRTNAGIRDANETKTQQERDIASNMIEHGLNGLAKSAVALHSDNMQRQAQDAMIRSGIIGTSDTTVSMDPATGQYTLVYKKPDGTYKAFVDFKKGLVTNETKLK